MIIYCEDCERPHFSKTGNARKCIVCWKITRGYELSKTDIAHQNLSNALHGFMEENKKLKMTPAALDQGTRERCLFLEKERLIRMQETAALHRQVEALTKEAEELRKTQQAPSLTESTLKELITLSHPDKHGGSALSTRVTQWLLSLRKKK